MFYTLGAILWIVRNTKDSEAMDEPKYIWPTKEGSHFAADDWYLRWFASDQPPTNFGRGQSEEAKAKTKYKMATTRAKAEDEED